MRLDVNARTYLGKSALSLAASKGHLHVVKCLLQDRRVDPNGVDKIGCTAFWCAARAGRTEIMARLLKDCVLTQLKDKNGKDALDAASNNNYFNMALLIQGMLREWERESRST